MAMHRWVITATFSLGVFPFTVMAAVSQASSGAPSGASTILPTPQVTTSVSQQYSTKENSLATDSGTATADTGSVEKSTKTIESLSRQTRRLDKGYLRLVAPGKPYFEELPSTTFDLQLLKNRNNIEPHTLNLGGYLEFDAQYWHAHSGGVVVGPSHELLPDQGEGLYTTTVDLDTLANLNDYTTFFAKVEQEDIGTPQAHMIFRKALLNFGNLDKSPFFLTLGKSYLPFGVYGGGGVWSVPLTRSAFRPSEVPQIMLGYFKDGFNSNLAVFGNDGDTTNKEIADYVYSVYFSGTPQYGVGYTVGAGYMNDLRGLSSSLGAAYKQNGELSASKHVPAYDLNAEASYSNLDLTAEYISALRQGTYNSNVDTTGQDIVSAGETQELPSAWELGASYTKPWCNRPMYYSLSYSKTYHMAGIPMGLSSQPIPGPVAVEGIQSAWIASIARSLEDNLILGFEWQRAHTYDANSGDSYTLDLSMYF